MAARLSVFALVFLIGTLGSHETAPELIVWNVGQGQWVTIIDDQACWHFDMGGEFAPWREIIQRCRKRTNRVSLSHWDSDHISFAGKARAHLPDICMLAAPLGRANPRKEALIAPIPPCATAIPFLQWTNALGKTSNAKSRVINWRGILDPGDSSRHEESQWIHQFKNLAQVRVLVLGHHGSRTANSRALLRALRRLKFAIASSRMRRYGHPHAEVVRDLSQLRIPLLRTEEWGSIHVML